MKFFKIFKWIGIGLGALPLILLAVILLVNIVFSLQLNRVLKNLQARGVPLRIEEVTPPAIPDADNAAIPLNNVLSLLTNSASGDLQVLADIAITNALTGKTPKRITDWPGEQREKALEILQSEAMLELYWLMEDAAQRPGFNNNIDYSEGPGALCPFYGGFRTIARLLDVKAGFEAEAGEIGKALKTILVGLTANSKLKEEPLLITQLVRIGVEWIYIKRLETLAGAHALPHDQTLAIIKKLERSSEMPWEQILNMERLGVGFWIYNMLDHGDSETSSFIYGIANRAFSSWLLGPIRKKDMMVYLDLMDGFHRRSSEPFYLVADEVQNSTVMEQLPWYAFVACLSLPDFDRVIERVAEHQARSAVARVGLMLNLFKQKDGVYPAKLEELEPEFFADVPIDPFTGQALVYRRDGEGYILYSLGRNRADNNGLPYDPETRLDEQDYDIVWKCQM